MYKWVTIKAKEATKYYLSQKDSETKLKNLPLAKDGTIWTSVKMINAWTEQTFKNPFIHNDAKKNK